MGLLFGGMTTTGFSMIFQIMVAFQTWGSFKLGRHPLYVEQVCVFFVDLVQSGDESL